MQQIKKQEMDKKFLMLNFLTLFGIGTLTVGCGISKIDKPLLNVSARGKQECLKRSELGKNSFTSKQIYSECLETIDATLAQRDAYEAELYFERKRQEEELEKQKTAENQKIQAELDQLKAEKRKLRQEKKRLAAAKAAKKEKRRLAAAKAARREKKKLAATKRNKDENDCKEGSIIGGVLGAGITMSATKGKDRWWAVPLGATAGSLVGCQVDGG